MLVDAIGQEAGERGIGSTGASVAKSLNRMRGWKVKRVRKTAANAALFERQYAYWMAAKSGLDPARVGTICVAMDATRMGGLDTLYMAAFCPETQLACWLPPQATRVEKGVGFWARFILPIGRV